jgi:osmotically-inducible protein OsmY
VVDLTGTVDTQENRDKAQQVAERFSGVKFVENQLVVSPS